MTYSVNKVKALRKKNLVQGWFVRFKERHCVPHFKMNSTASGNKDAYLEVLKSIIEEGKYTPHQVFI
uniref:HTH CENPB-type domain-containing protein n=1 Tax=Molossus molossus TaxID=27622 RepID=A0A7J8C6B9_MOLMO|nr:hypothetical protein HJG59_002659 [Molossus molossus]